MTAGEIRKAKFECDTGAYECARWLQEIAAQLAELQELLRYIIEPHRKGSIRIR